MIWTAVLIVLLVGYVFFYNQLIKLDALAAEGQNSLNLCLERRRDLFSQLIRLTANQRIAPAEPASKIYEQHEHADAVSKAAEQQQQAENQLEKVLKQLWAAAESNPALKADPEFRQLQQNFAAVEAELQNACRDYNASVRDYNVALHTFPSGWIAKSMKAKEKSFFKLNPPQP